MARHENNGLPTKEAGLFRQIVKFYETKQYKKGLKAAEQVLKKFPEHGETLAMKGLILNCQEKKEEAYEYTKRGLRHDVKSHVCWHVFGLVHRSDRNYEEAIKCYKQALRIDKENHQILRDLALLQVQMRDMAGFVETRQQLLILKPANKTNWISLAIAHHLSGNHAVAAQVVGSYEGMQDEEVPPGETFETSELRLYKALILEEGGDLEAALDILHQHEEEIKDKLGLLEQRARVLVKLGDVDEASSVYRLLVRANPDNYRYHESLRSALGLAPDAKGCWSEEQRARLAELYNELAAESPRGIAARRIPLDFLSGEEFEAAAERYVRRYLQRGVPSLFSDLKMLYKDADKKESLGRIFERLLASLEATGAFPPLPDQCAGEGGPHNNGKKAAQDQDDQLWTMFYLAQHYDKLGRSEDALDMLARCVERMPDLPDLYSAKCRILKHAGDLEGAASAAVKAQSFDLDDRFLNSMAAKWLFRAGEIDRGEKMAALFTRDGDQVNNLADMQCMWYEMEAGNAHLRQNAYGQALKKFLAVSKHFADFHEDQFDFHSYCVRQMTLRSYISMLRMEDNLYDHPAYVKAASGAVTAYLQLYDTPRDTGAEQDSEEAKMAAMTADERRKYKQKRRKEQQRQEKEAAEREAAAREASAKEAAARDGGGGKEKGASKKAPPPKEKDPDPNGAALAATPDPLGEASKLVRMLKTHAEGRLQTHLLAFEVYLRKGRPLLALQAVKQAWRLAGPDSPDVHPLVVRLAVALQPPTLAVPNGKVREETDGAGAAAELDPVVRQVIDAHVPQLLDNGSVEQYNEAWVARTGTASVAHRLAAADTLRLLRPAERQRALDVLLSAGDATEALSHGEAEAIHKRLAGPYGDPHAADAWCSQCQQRFPYSSIFRGAKRLPLEEPAPTKRINGVERSIQHLSLESR